MGNAVQQGFQQESKLHSSQRGAGADMDSGPPEEVCALVSFGAVLLGLRERGVHLTTVRADLADFVIEPEAWDVIVSIWAHTPPILRRDLHRRVVKGLRPVGALVLEAYTPHQLSYGTGGPPDVDLLMTLAGLRQELEGLRFEAGVETVREVQEGRYHSGPSAVVQVLAFAP